MLEYYTQNAAIKIRPKNNKQTLKTFLFLLVATTFNLNMFISTLQKVIKTHCWWSTNGAVLLRTKTYPDGRYKFLCSIMWSSPCLIYNSSSQCLNMLSIQAGFSKIWIIHTEPWHFTGNLDEKLTWFGCHLSTKLAQIRKIGLGMFR